MTSKLKIAPLLLVLSSLIATPVWAVELSSGKQQNSLIELFTSQGCNSCPPAEKYLNSFTTHDQLWEAYIPVAFHVDYWDYLGWKDRFAKPEHRVRQEAYAKVNRQNTIYTPGFYVNGKPWRRGFFKRDPEQASDRPGRLSVSITDNIVNAKFDPLAIKDDTLILHIAVLGMNLQTDIRAGENAGRRSGHEFVALHHQSVVSKNRRWQTKLDKTTFPETGKIAIAAWVTRDNDPRPLQAVGGYLTTN